jgi:hypothetical protein
VLISAQYPHADRKNIIRKMMNLLRALYSMILAIIGVPFLFPETENGQGE